MQVRRAPGVAGDIAASGQDIAGHKAGVNVDVTSDGDDANPRRPQRKIRAGDLLGALTKDLGDRAAQIGKIKVNDFST